MSAHEAIFEKRLEQLRGAELKILLKRQLVASLISVIEWAGVAIVSCATLGAHIFLGEPISAKTVFSVFFYCNLLLGPFEWLTASFNVMYFSERK